MAHAKIFNNALAGAMAGSQSARNPTDATPGDYAALKDSCANFAAAVDAAISVDADTVAKETCLVSLCAAVFASKYPQAGATQAQFAALAAGVAASFTETIAAFH
jgi:hypothetical protein